MNSLPYSIRVNLSVPFPALVFGASGVRLTKTNGIWSVALDYSSLSAQTPPAGDYAVSYMLVWDSQTGVYSLVSIATLAAIGGGGGGGGGANVYTTVIAAGTYVALTTDTYILINRTVPAAGGVRLPASASKVGFPIVVKDIAGDGATHNTSVTFTGGETCDGQATITINSNYGGYRFAPLPAGGWTISP